ncbi:hypothetical protein [Hyalangium versicolor]|uniref:hypothetical protein n=1 Tax=Hyalangium versicolor TaxID=2861190 RepID=UPI001CCF160E|nr:hypothetical protein [Hyalangium versicolor]
MNTTELQAVTQAFRTVNRHLLCAAAAYRLAWKAQRTAMEALTAANNVLAAAEARGELTVPVARSVRAFVNAAETSQILEVTMDDSSQRELANEAQAIEETAHAASGVAEVLRLQGGGAA